ncbi:MAG: efflux RND transporter periplasmic adaptor subunit [Alphaproteobacteria bacterium]
MWFLFLFVFLFLAGCDKTPEEKGKLAQAIYVQPQKYVEKSVFYGTVQARQSSPLVVQTDGVLDWLTQSGDEILTSQTIAKIDNPEIEKAHELASSAEAIAKQQYNRSAALAKSNTTSHQQLQEREQAWITAQQNLAKAETDRKKALFIAPFDGIVGPQLIHEGTHVKTGDVIGHFFNPSDLVVEVQIPVSYKESLKENQTAMVEGKPYSLPHVPKMLNPTTHMMVIHIPIKHSTLLVGEIVDVEIYLNESNQVIALPLGSIKFEDGETSVLVSNKGKLEKREITLGTKDAKKAVVLNGIQAGDTVCLDPHHHFEGESITPQYPEL